MEARITQAAMRAMGSASPRPKSMLRIRRVPTRAIGTPTAMPISIRMEVSRNTWRKIVEGLAPSDKIIRVHRLLHQIGHGVNFDFRNRRVGVVDYCAKRARDTGSIARDTNFKVGHVALP